MNTKQNLTYAIANQLLELSPIVTPTHAIGAGLAVMSSLAGSGYYYKSPMNPKGEDVFSVVNQGVVLVGSSGSGKGNIIQAAKEFLMAVSPEYPIVSGFPSANAIWQRVERDQPLMVLEHESHHETLAKLHRGDLRNEAARDKKAYSPVSKASLLSRIQRERFNWLVRPHGVKGGKSAITPAPLTILGETTDTAFDDLLPESFAGSPFYGGLLFMPTDFSLRIKNFRNWQLRPAPAGGLIEKAKLLYAKRRTDNPTLVEISSVAEKLYKTLAVKAYADLLIPQMFCPQVLSVASLLAIGRDWENPMISESDMAEALVIGWFSCEQARLGLEGFAKPSPLTPIFEEFLGAYLNLQN
ncbi:hypothetical protein WKI13_18910 [Teredinibacter turnerae]|uniref:hypothetical protein n=1 Tax=Teredinibacter turnerae TaxID=2426 RepID=UPI0003664EF9|nr:hypothetical protein [Teredinibacter turnerae]